MLRSLVRDPQLVTANLGILFLIGVAVVVPVAWPHDAFEVDVLGSLAAPSLTHPMGTDDVGRDLLARFAVGARISLLVGFAVTLAAGLVGSLLGLLAGYFGGWIDGVISRVMDAILSFPPIIFAMAVTIGMGAGLVTAAIGIAIAAVPWYARLVRADAMRTRAMPFVEAATALGAVHGRVLLLHIAPQAVTTLLIQSAAVFGYAILTLAGLGFIGLGAQIPTPEWGTMITEGLAYALTGQWWLGVFPGIGILIAVTSANVIADRVRDLLDPHGEVAVDTAGA